MIRMRIYLNFIVSASSVILSEVTLTSDFDAVLYPNRKPLYFLCWRSDICRWLILLTYNLADDKSRCCHLNPNNLHRLGNIHQKKLVLFPSDLKPGFVHPPNVPMDPNHCLYLWLWNYLKKKNNMYTCYHFIFMNINLQKLKDLFKKTWSVCFIFA